MSHNYDISIIVTAHKEGRLAHRTMRSLLRAIRYAKSGNVNSQLVIILDKPDSHTSKYFSREFNVDSTIQLVDFGDLSASRGLGIDLASGKYVTLLNACDLVSENWLLSSYQYLEKCNKEIIVHPEYQICFQDKNEIWPQVQSNSLNFNVGNLLEANYWTYFTVALKSTFKKIMDCDNNHGDQYYNHWLSCCNSLAIGIDHYIIEHSACFLRHNKIPNYHNYSEADIFWYTKLFDTNTLTGIIYTDNKHSLLLDKPKEKTKVLSNIKVIIKCVTDPIFTKWPQIYKVVSKYTHGCDAVLSSENHIPEWLISEWKLIHTIELMTYPDKSLLCSISFNDFSKTKLIHEYLKLCKFCSDDLTHVFLVPWLNTGGADLLTLNYIHALTSSCLSCKIVVITTMKAESPWSKRLPEGVRIIEFGIEFSCLSDNEQEILLVRFLLQKSPKVIHLFNSDLGNRVIEKYGQYITMYSKIYASAFCIDINDEGKIFGYPFRYFPSIVDYIESVFTDNQSFIDYVCELYAFEDDKFKVHYQPIKITNRVVYENKIPYNKHINILWAGRIDRQKRPDILADIAEACLDLPLKFHVYGSAVIDRDIYSSRLNRIPNIIYHGPFEGLQSLPTDNYDLFLYTSQWDGLPNILLEAMSLGLPIIAPDVGGVSELIIHNETGYLIRAFDNIDEYVCCLKNILSDNSRLTNIVENAYMLIENRHSWDTFNDSIKASKGYCLY